MKWAFLVVVSLLLVISVRAYADEPINLLINYYSYNVTSFLNSTDINSTGYYNLTVAEAYHLLNATQESQFTNTYNSTYDAKITDNTSWNETRAGLLYALITWNYNQTAPAVTYVNSNPFNWLNKTTLNSSGYYNITSQICYYVGNTTERDAFLSTYNATYDAMISGNASWNETRASLLYASITWNYNQTTPAINYVNANPFGWINTSYNSTYDAKVTDNTSWNETRASSLYLSSYTESDPIFSSNLSSYNSTWSTTFNSSYDAKVTDNTSWNETRASAIYAPLGAGNTSWNETRTSVLYASITWNYNQTTPAINYMNSNPFNWLNTTYNASYESTYNATYDAKVTDNTSWNETRASSLYLSSYSESDPRWSGNYTAFNSSWSSTYNSTYDAKVTDNTSWNETRASSLYLKSYSETDPIWSGNYTTYNSSWSSTYNSSYDAKVTDNTSWNETRASSLYLKSYTETDPIWSSNYTAYNSSWSSTYNSTYQTWAYNQTTPAVDWVSAQGYLKNWANVSTTSCGAGSHISAINNATGAVTCTADTVGTESDPIWSGNYTAYNSSWSSTYNSTYDAKVTDNTSWNETRASSLYLKTYTESDPIFSSNLSSYNSTWSSTYNSTYATWAYNQTTPAVTWVQNQGYLTSYSETDPIWSSNYTTYNSSWSSTYNSTYDSKVTDNTSWNETRASSLYLKSYTESDPIWSSNYTAYNASWSSTYNATYDALSSGNSSWNETRAGALYHLLTNTTLAPNQTKQAVDWVSAQGYLSSFTEVDPAWAANYSLYNSTWSSTYNSTYAQWAYNQTTPAITWVQNQGYLSSYTESDPIWSSNYTTFNSSWSTTYNSTYDAKTSDNTTWNETRAGTLYHLLTNSTLAPNQTLMAVNWVNAQGYLTSYTESDPKWSSNYTTYNSSWSTTYNSTYDTWAYNQTTQAIVKANSLYLNQSEGIYNSSYQYWNNATLAPNQTLAAVNWVSAQSYAPNSKLTNCTSNQFAIGFNTGTLCYQPTFGNLTGFDLNKVWTNTLGGANITLGTLTANQLASTFAINFGNITNGLNNLWTTTLGGGNLTTNTVTDTQVQDDITVNSTKWVNTTIGMNTSKIYAPLICFNQACTKNQTYNGTNVIIYG